MTNGAGNYATWLPRFYRFRRYRSQLAPTSGPMGYGLPAAVAAKAVHPQRPVICFAGDGCYMMHGQELATAVQYGLPIIVIVVNNGRSEEHTSELPSLMRLSDAVFCLNTKTKRNNNPNA